MSVEQEKKMDVGPERNSLLAYARNWLVGLRSGELGVLPIIGGLLLTAVVFQSLNDNYLTPGNLVNLVSQGAAISTIAMGLVLVLLIGEIDLSVGYVSGVAAVILAQMLLPDGSDLPTGFALLAAVAAGMSIGALHGLLITKLKMPSFVVTLAGLLAWNGVVLMIIGSQGSIIIQDRAVVSLSGSYLTPDVAWAFFGILMVAYSISLVLARRNRMSRNLAVEPAALLLLRIVGLALVAGTVVSVANLSRGIPFVVVLITVLYVVLNYVLTNTRFGVWVYSIGGSIEAARRAGINTDRVRIYVFMIASSMAAIGGIILASRLRSVDSNVGGGSLLLYSIAAAVIGGTSLFGGRGSARSAILGALVIASIDNGLGLLGLGSGQKFTITGLVLLAAVAVDSLSRYGRIQAGRS
ncbi:MAG: ABC transporter permease [Nocardioidaceae bacterium]|nr:ABC transporter permease [Nocardioidaceae bacterium]